MSFNTEVVKDGRGRVLLVDVSYDNFSTFAYRFADKAGVLEGGTGRSNRIVSLSAIRRGFGSNRVAAGGSCELVLDNADGEIDSLAGRENMSNIAAARMRIYVALYDPTAATLSFDTKLLGVFVISEWPRQTNETITFQLGDDILGPLGQSVPLPTLRDWALVGTAATNPLLNSYGEVGCPSFIDKYTPVQLAFGEDWVQALPHILPYGDGITPTDAAYRGKVIVPICATTDTGTAADQFEITNLRVWWRGWGGGVAIGSEARLLDIPRSVVMSFGSSDDELVDVWTVERSPVITKNGLDFVIIYLVVRADLACDLIDVNWITRTKTDFKAGAYGSLLEQSRQWEQADGYPQDCLNQMRTYSNSAAEGANYASFAASVGAWWVKGFPLSMTSSDSYGIGANPSQHTAAIIRDLAENYASQPLTVDTTSFDYVRSSNPTSMAAGLVAPWKRAKENLGASSLPQSLRQAFTALCQSGDLDIFINWDGELAFSSDIRVYYLFTASRASVTFDDTVTSDIERWMASGTERYAPFNRLLLASGKAYDAEGLEAPFAGPFDFDAGETGVDQSDRVIEVSLQQGWRPWRQQSQTPLNYRLLSPEARDKIRFRTNIAGLQVDLGDYFYFTWNRGEAGAIYDTVLFQVEAITYAPGDDSVEIEAVWFNDIATENAYLLDNETLLVRTKSGSGAADTDGTDLVEFGGTIDLTAMGVAVGDILILRDTAEAPEAFTRNAAFRITTVTATPASVNVVDSTGSPAVIPAASVVNADWSIVRGYTTYPTEVSDPTNYPDGASMYGKVTNAAGVYSNSDTGNRLITG